MYTAGTPPQGFDPEEHAATELDPATVIPEGVTTLTDFYAVKRRSEQVENPITCWHCYTDGTHTWCVEVDCPWGVMTVSE